MGLWVLVSPGSPQAATSAIDDAVQSNIDRARLDQHACTDWC
jgi:hypothetical protein